MFPRGISDPPTMPTQVSPTFSSAVCAEGLRWGANEARIIEARPDTNRPMIDHPATLSECEVCMETPISEIAVTQWHRVTECLPIIHHYGTKRNDANELFRIRAGTGQGWHAHSSRTVLVWSDYDQDYVKTNLSMSYTSCGDRNYYSARWRGIQMSPGDQWMEIPAKRAGYPAPLPPNDEDLERYRKSREQQDAMLERFAESVGKQMARILSEAT